MNINITKESHQGFTHHEHVTIREDTASRNDPLKCAIALGWRKGVEIETVPLKLETTEGWLYGIPASTGIPTRLVTNIDGNTFNEYWGNILCR